MKIFRNSNQRNHEANPTIPRSIRLSTVSYTTTDLNHIISQHSRIHQIHSSCSISQLTCSAIVAGSRVRSKFRWHYEKGR
ncbi:hypothetical protein Mapa_017490 [Marchantia paleacea]|nr:hypothetical protein Mapa_017490 [Marchantia paleacea]